MPYKHDEMKIPNRYKRSAKLSPDDKEEIRYRYLKVGGVSQRELAKEYNVSRRLIIFCIYPERLKANYAKRVESGGSKQYYNKEYNTTKVRECRQYKQKLKLEGKLNDEGGATKTKQSKES